VVPAQGGGQATCSEVRHLVTTLVGETVVKADAGI